MSVLPVGMGSSGADVGDIGHSVRLRASASAYLSRTFGTPTNRDKWTYSCWVKRGSLGALRQIFRTTDATNPQVQLYFDSSDRLQFDQWNGVGWDFYKYTSAIYRDPSTYLHIVAVYDSANATPEDRNIVYVNGTRISSWANSSNSSLSLAGGINTARLHYIGSNSGVAEFLDGYLSRVCFVDGQALTPDSFGYLNTDINEWVSKTKQQIRAAIAVGGGPRNGWGANGCMENFEDATSLTTLGYDTSQADDGTGGNHWTCNNISLTAGVTYDHMLDVPGNSFATLNPLIPSAASITNGNLTSGTTAVRATMNALAFDSKWEVTAGGSAVTAGVISSTGTTNTTSVTANKTFAFRITAAGALDYKNVTDGGSWTSITTGLTGEQYPYGVTQAANWNFGQAPLHASATYQSANGGYFFDTTAGFKALCQRNLADPAATLLDPTDHHIDIAVTKSGNTNFTLPWDASVYDTFFEIKRRDAAGDWYQIDGLRGYDKILKSNSTAAETTDANVLGISGTTGTLKSTLSDGTYIVSATKAGLTASRQTNTDGTITSTVSRNVDSGFAIVTCTGSAANATVGHGLGAVLKTIIAKATGAVTEWPVYNAALANTEYLVLNTTAAKASGATYWNSTTPTTTVFSLGSSTNTNNSGGMVFYCYADSAIQKSFSYTAAASADGPYVNLGFKPASTLHKVVTAGDNWASLNAAIYPSNAVTTYLYRNGTAGDTSITSGTVDLNATGIKIRTPADGMGSAQTIIGHAWAAVTGKYSNAR